MGHAYLVEHLISLKILQANACHICFRVTKQYNEQLNSKAVKQYNEVEFQESQLLGGQFSVFASKKLHTNQ